MSTVSFDEMWRNADPDAVGGDDSNPPEPGVYVATLVDASAFFSRAGEAFQKMRWSCVETPHEWTVLSGFKTQGAANFAKNQARSVGVNVEAVASMEQLSAALEAQKGGWFEVEVVRNGDYINTYVRGRAQDHRAEASGFGPASAPAAAAPAPAPGSIDTSDVPF